MFNAIKAVATRYKKAKKEYYETFNDWFAALKPLPDDKFWKIMESYKNIVGTYVNYSISYPTQEFFRKCLANAWNENEKPYTIYNAIKFARTYEVITEKMYDLCSAQKFEFDLSDDRFDDLTDSLPIAGKQMWVDLLEKKFNTLLDFRKALRKYTKDYPYLFTHITEGENYHATKLMKQASKYLINYL